MVRTKCFNITLIKKKNELKMYLKSPKRSKLGIKIF